MYKVQWIFSHTQYYRNLEKRSHADPGPLVTPAPRVLPQATSPLAGLAGPTGNYLISEEIFSIDSVCWRYFVFKEWESELNASYYTESIEKISSLIR